MTLSLFNSLGRKLEPFLPLEPGSVRMYTCGPTVWNYAHIGNYRTFVFEDLLRRYLKFKGFRVTQVMNITDVEDKIIRGIRESGKSREELTAFYEKEFFEDLATLGVEKAEFYPRATEHIPEMVALIKVLLRKGFAYRVDDGSIYYDVSKFKKYGTLSGIRPSELKAGARVAQDSYGKEEANDFALWKAWVPDDGEVFWQTELGKGRPGWSIECSAMSMKYLGESFDLHTGGLDNRFPHHENEIAQSEAATGRQFVRYWLHSDFLNAKGEEMHKSVGNVAYLRDLVSDGWHPMTIRLFLISARYRDAIDLTEGALRQAEARRERLQELIARLKGARGEESPSEDLASELTEGFEDAMDDDLNTPAALASVFSVSKKANGMLDRSELGSSGAKRVLASLERINSVIGVLDFGEEPLPEHLAEMIRRREEARAKKDFVSADRLREELLREGVVVEDTPDGPAWKRKPRG